jgi:hypothetical protein
MAMIRRWLGRVGRDRRWISDPTDRAAHDEVVRERLEPRVENGGGDGDNLAIVFDGGPRHGEAATLDHQPVVIGTGAEGGVYQRADEQREGLQVYRWQMITDAEAAALVEGDLRANQEPE